MQEDISRLVGNIQKVILGKPDAVRLAVVCLLAKGHLLIEDVPGVGKTTLAHAIAKSLACSFRRIQFTPDLLPCDITGVSVFDADRKEFVFKPGPIFANVILADEINRTTPRTQSALLEAMNDYQVTVDGITHVLSQPFMVIATQNPLEYTGTYPLPESQLDRFLMKIGIGYPDHAQELEVLTSRSASDPLIGLAPVLDAKSVGAMTNAVKSVRMDPAIAAYILAIADRTRQDPAVLAGVSPRGGIFLHRAAQAMALVAGRNYVIPDDIKALAVPVLAHRIIEKARRFSFEGRSSAAAIIGRIIEELPVPG
jgi:MoxR-like ATPase